MRWAVTSCFLVAACSNATPTPTPDPLAADIANEAQASSPLAQKVDKIEARLRILEDAAISRGGTVKRSDNRAKATDDMLRDQARQQLDGRVEQLETKARIDR